MVRGSYLPCVKIFWNLYVYTVICNINYHIYIFLLPHIQHKSLIVLSSNQFTVRWQEFDPQSKCAQFFSGEWESVANANLLRNFKLRRGSWHLNLIWTEKCINLQHQVDVGFGIKVAGKLCIWICVGTITTLGSNTEQATQSLDDRCLLFLPIVLITACPLRSRSTHTFGYYIGKGSYLTR